MCDSNETTNPSVEKEEDECIKCPRGHELQYYSPGATFIMYRCDICGHNIKCSQKRYRCGTCDFDMCDACKSNPELLVTAQVIDHSMTEDWDYYDDGDYYDNVNPDVDPDVDPDIDPNVDPK